MPEHTSIEPRKTNHGRTVDVITSAKANLENLLPLVDPSHPQFNLMLAVADLDNIAHNLQKLSTDLRELSIDALRKVQRDIHSI